MFPEVCRIGPFTVYSYGIMMVLAFSISIGLAMQHAKKDGISPQIILNLGYWTFCFGIVGARIFYVLENLKYYSGNPLEIIMLSHGGLSWFGGLIAGVSFALIYLRRHKQPVYKILDTLVPFIAFAQSIGRIGCFLNGCCFGRNDIPIQLYSSLSLLCIFVILRFLQERPHRVGEIFYSYLLLYSVKRFFVEFWRADNPVILAGLTLFQALSVLLFCLALVKLIQSRSCKT